MKVHNNITHVTPWCCLLVFLCVSPLTLAQSGAGKQGWEVNQDVFVNQFNRSPLEMSGDSSLNLPADDALMPVFRSLTVTSPDIYGVRGTAAITRSVPDYGNFNKILDHKYATQLRARAIYSSFFAKGNVNLWLGALWRQQAVNSILAGIQTDSNSFGYNIGIDVNYADFSISGSYYGGHALKDIYSTPYLAFDTADCLGGLCNSGKQGYILKGFYAVTGTTRFGISYGESIHNTLMNSATVAGTVPFDMTIRSRR